MKMSEKMGFNLSDVVRSVLKIRPKENHDIKLFGSFGFRCYEKDSLVVGSHYAGVKMKWEDNWDHKDHNLIVNVGLTYLVGVALIGVTQDTTWFIGLTDNSPTVVAANTMASHAGWTEFDEYSETTRQAWTGAAGAAGVVTNTASPSTFTINNTTNGGLGGAFMAGVNTKNETASLLFAAKALTGGNRTVAQNDVVQVTYVVTATSS